VELGSNHPPRQCHRDEPNDKERGTNRKSWETYHVEKKKGPALDAKRRVATKKRYQTKTKRMRKKISGLPVRKRCLGIKKRGENKTKEGRLRNWRCFRTTEERANPRPSCMSGAKLEAADFHAGNSRTLMIARRIGSNPSKATCEGDA